MSTQSQYSTELDEWEPDEKVYPIVVPVINPITGVQLRCGSGWGPIEAIERKYAVAGGARAGEEGHLDYLADVLEEPPVIISLFAEDNQGRLFAHTHKGYIACEELIA